MEQVDYSSFRDLLWSVGSVSLMSGRDGRSLLMAMPGVPASASSISEEQYTILVMTLSDSDEAAAVDCGHDATNPVGGRWEKFTTVTNSLAAQQVIGGNDFKLLPVLVIVRPEFLPVPFLPDDDIRTAAEYFNAWKGASGAYDAVINAVCRQDLHGGLGALQTASMELNFNGFKGSLKYVSEDYETRTQVESMPAVWTCLPPRASRLLKQLALDSLEGIPDDLSKISQVERLLALEILATAVQAPTIESLLNHFLSDPGGAFRARYKSIGTWPDGTNGGLMIGVRDETGECFPFCLTSTTPGKTLKDSISMLFDETVNPIVMYDSSEGYHERPPDITYDMTVGDVAGRLPPCLRFWVVCTMISGDVGLGGFTDSYVLDGAVRWLQGPPSIRAQSPYESEHIMHQQIAGLKKAQEATQTQLQRMESHLKLILAKIGPSG